jgi:hypothetical protein
MAVVQTFQHAARAVPRSVIDDDDLARGWKVDRQQPVDDRGDRRRLVVDGNNDRDRRTQGRHSTRAMCYVLRATCYVLRATCSRARVLRGNGRT